jgi:hypothetical protein
MNLSEMAKLLATVSLIDPRVSRRSDTEKELMAKAWLVVIGEEISYEFAAKCAQEHYKTSSDTFMPVHIVSKWKIERDKQREKDHLLAITAKTESVPMPDNVRAIIRDLSKNKP